MTRAPRIGIRSTTTRCCLPVASVTVHSASRAIAGDDALGATCNSVAVASHRAAVRRLGALMTSTVAWVFPGQGSQIVGMGKDLADRYTTAARVFEEANEAIGVDLRALCFDGPQAELDRTTNTQPALVATSIAALRAAEQAMGGSL